MLSLHRLPHHAFSFASTRVTSAKFCRVSVALASRLADRFDSLFVYSRRFHCFLCFLSLWICHTMQYCHLCVRAECISLQHNCHHCSATSSAVCGEFHCLLGSSRDAVQSGFAAAVMRRGSRNDFHRARGSATVREQRMYSNAPRVHQWRRHAGKRHRESVLARATSRRHRGFAVRRKTLSCMTAIGKTTRR